MQVGPPISVVICAYNAEKYLKRTISSIRRQTYMNIEILIIDDASTDSTAQIIDEAASQDNRIRYIRHLENGGIANARQTGLENAKYDWVSFLDADDIAHAKVIERQIQKIIEDEDLIAVGTYAYYIDEDDKKIIGVQKIGPKNKGEFIHLYKKAKLVFMSNTTIYSKKHALKVGGYRINYFPQDDVVRLQDFCEDLDLWCRLSDFGAEGKYMITIPEPLFYYRKRRESLSSKNIFSMQNKMRWIKDCLKRRRAGFQERTYEDFESSLSLWERLNNLRVDYAAYFYRKAGFKYMRKKYVQALVFLLIVMVLNPRYIFDKVRTQKVFK